METSSIVLQLLAIALSAGVLGISLLILHKTRKIHLASFRLLDDAEVTRKETTSLFQQFVALNALEKKLGFQEALPATRGWVGSPDFLCTVADALLEGKPKTVVECSSGVSTLVIARCLQLTGEGHLYSLEHESDYADKTREMLERFGVACWATVLDAPLARQNGGSPWYDDSVLPAHLDPIEILVVDGPPHDTAPLARLPAFPRLLPRMSESAVVILDDAARKAEQEIVRHWIQLAPDWELTYLHHEKGCAILKR